MGHDQVPTATLLNLRDCGGGSIINGHWILATKAPDCFGHPSKRLNSKYCPFFKNSIVNPEIYFLEVYFALTHDTTL